MSEQPFGTGDASYQAAGQLAGIEHLVERFYHYMDCLPEAATIRAMHAPDLTESKRKLAFFLSGWLGGPKLYSQHYGGITIPLAHAHLRVDGPERDAWLLCMQKAVDEQPYTREFKTYLMVQLAVPAERVRQASVAKRNAAN